MDVLLTAFILTVFVYLLRHNLTSTFYNISTIICPSNRLVHLDQDLALALAGRSYAQYSSLAHAELARMRASYGTIGRQHKRIGFELGYTRKLNKLEETIKANALVAKKISALATVGCCRPMGDKEMQQLERIREVLKHFVRDWSEEGASERLKTFSPILDELKKISVYKRREMMVLVPGAGLARLPWEIASLGFNTTSNELSGYMNLAFRFLLSRSTTSRIHQHVLHPFAHWFSHQRTNKSLFRTVSFPDVLPSLFPESQLHHKESDFLDLPHVRHGYDYVVTHYFIDTSRNIIATLQKIHSLLRSGGMWINLGPLLWISGAQATMELNLEEVLELSRIAGFELHEDSRRTVPSEYTRDEGAMMRWIYEAEFWIATKI